MVNIFFVTLRSETAAAVAQRISEPGSAQRGSAEKFTKKTELFWGEPREASECLNIVLNRKYIKIPDRRKFFG